jgi:hypothetical protein
MRRFIVMNPNLSVGRPGDVVTAAQLNMSDDKLDEWVAANHGIEIDETPETIYDDDDEDYDDEEA